MKQGKDNPVLLNLQDSVSRIVENLGFACIEEAAHSRLVGIMAAMLRSMGHTCRTLAENAGRAPFSLTTVVDVKHLFRIHRVDLEQLTEYAHQVRPFPPRECDVHAEKPKQIPSELRKKSLSSVDANTQVVKHPTPPPPYEFPRFDDLDYVELGFHQSEESPAPSPIPPTPIPPSTSAYTSPVYDIPMFDPDVTPPPISFIPRYASPEPDRAPREDPFSLSKFVQDYQIKEEQREISKPARSLKNEYQKMYAEKTPSSTSLGVPKKTRKRQRQSNYEQRLREEILAEAEKTKERKERRRMKAEMMTKRRSAEREAETKTVETQDRIVFKFSARVLEQYYEHTANNMNQDASSSFEIDENDNKKMKTKKLSNASTSSATLSTEDVTDPKPLPKMFIRFRRVPKGILVKKIIRTKYRWKDGKWKPKEETWNNNRGVLSQSEEPHKTRPIPKLRIIKKKDGSYSLA